MKVVESKVAELRESGISGKVGQATDNAKKLPGIVNKQTEVALDRVEDVINQVASYPVGELSGREQIGYKSDPKELLLEPFPLLNSV